MRGLALPSLTLAALLVAGCGSGKSASATTTTTTEKASPPSATTQHPTTRPTTVSSPSALQAEANSAAAGDIPDNQIFIVFRNRPAGYSMRYPEGWAQQGAGSRVTFRDKNNIVRVVVVPGAMPSTEAVRRALAALRGAHLQSEPQQLTIGGSGALRVVYTTKSAPSPVTGKRVTLVVDRYYLSQRRRTVVVDLGTPQGVDNVDAYRLMIESFRWR